jgi:hypothetical protein
MVFILFFLMIVRKIITVSDIIKHYTARVNIIVNTILLLNHSFNYFIEVTSILEPICQVIQLIL